MIPVVIKGDSRRSLHLILFGKANTSNTVAPTKRNCEEFSLQISSWSHAFWNDPFSINNNKKKKPFQPGMSWRVERRQDTGHFKKKNLTNLAIKISWDIYISCTLFMFRIRRMHAPFILLSLCLNFQRLT
jgi:hypothetical protein